MRFIPPLLATSCIMTSGLAATTLNVVKNYSLAKDATIWSKVKKDDVPASLVAQVELDNPTYAYSHLFPKSFYQDENFLVCYRDCKDKDAKSGKEALEQQTVYYWLTKFYAMAKERFDLAPTGRVRIMTDRRVANPGSSKVMSNNAFFNPADNTLSFLPVDSNPLASLLGADKLNRSGFDPSVITHEAGHSLFNALFPHAINQEISGFNEGFADYMANILMETSEVGLVMMRGKALRDSKSLTDSANKPKTYVAGQEVHDMGERFASALWLSRAKISDKDGFDRLVIDAVEEIAKNPFATGHGFKKAFLARVDFTYSSFEAKEIRALWDFFVDGDDRTFKDVSFLRTKIPSNGFLGIRTEARFPESVTREMGLTNTVNRFVFAKQTMTSEGYAAFLVGMQTDEAVMPYWILIDPIRGNALGAWRLDGSKVEESDLKVVGDLVTQVLTLKTTLSSFVEQVQTFKKLKDGQGDLAVAYKIASTKTKTTDGTFNGNDVKLVTTEMKVKRKLLALVLGVPQIRGFSFITTEQPVMKAGWIKFENRDVIGYSIELEDGTVTTSIFEQTKL